MRVLGQSDGIPCPRIKPRRPEHEKQSDNAVSPAKSDSANRAFSNFSLRKRPKLAHPINGLPKASSSQTERGSDSTIDDNNYEKSSETLSMAKKVAAKKYLKQKKKDIEEKMDED